MEEQNSVELAARKNIVRRRVHIVGLVLILIVLILIACEFLDIVLNH